jgi:hypothetical protein
MEEDRKEKLPLAGKSNLGSSRASTKVTNLVTIDLRELAEMTTV